jgi:hypothetical protein
VEELYILARQVLLDALEALGSHRDAVVLVGAQAVYLHVGSAEIAVAPFTTDGDLAIDPGLLAEAPPVEQDGAVGGEDDRQLAAERPCSTEGDSPTTPTTTTAGSEPLLLRPQLTGFDLSTEGRISSFSPAMYGRRPTGAIAVHAIKASSAYDSDMCRTCLLIGLTLFLGLLSACDRCPQRSPHEVAKDSLHVIPEDNHPPEWLRRRGDKAPSRKLTEEQLRKLHRHLQSVRVKGLVNETPDAQSTNLAKDLQLMWQTRLSSDRRHVSTPEAVEAASRVFNTVDLMGRSRADIVGKLGDPKNASPSAYNCPFWPVKGNVMVFRFDTGGHGWQFNVHFDQQGKATRVERRWIH